MLQMGLIYPQFIVKTYAKLKKSFRLVVLGYTWYFLIWEGAEPGPKPRKIEIFNWFPE